MKFFLIIFFTTQHLFIDLFTQNIQTHHIIKFCSIDHLEFQKFKKLLIGSLSNLFWFIQTFQQNKKSNKKSNQTIMKELNMLIINIRYVFYFTKIPLQMIIFYIYVARFNKKL